MVLIDMESLLSQMVLWFFVFVVVVIIGVIKWCKFRASGLQNYKEDLNYFGNPKKRKLTIGTGDDVNQVAFEMTPSQISKFRRAAGKTRGKDKEKQIEIAKTILSEDDALEINFNEVKDVNYEGMTITFPANWSIREKKTFSEDSLIVCANEFGEYFTLTKLNKREGSAEECLCSYISDNLSLISKKTEYCRGDVQRGNYKGFNCAYCGYCFKEKKVNYFGYVLAFVSDKNEEFVYHVTCCEDWSKLCSKGYLAIRDSITV